MAKGDPSMNDNEHPCDIVFTEIKQAVNTELHGLLDKSLEAFKKTHGDKAAEKQLAFLLGGITGHIINMLHTNIVRLNCEIRYMHAVLAAVAHRYGIPQKEWDKILEFAKQQFKMSVETDEIARLFNLPTKEDKSEVS